VHVMSLLLLQTRANLGAEQPTWQRKHNLLLLDNIAVLRVINRR